MSGMLSGVQNPPTQYTDDRNLAARQRFWAASRREPEFDLFTWVLDTVSLEADSTADVLDVGCGNGAYEALLRKRGHQGTTVALDLSLGMLEAVPGALPVNGDVQALPFAGSSFDVVLAPHMLYHVASVPTAAQECQRVLRAGGLFVAVTNGEQNLRPYVDLVEEAVGDGWRMRRPAEDHFSLENGGDQLRSAFESVERVDCPPSDVVVTDLDLLTDYIASVADHYESQVAKPWAAVVEQARRLAAPRLDDAGELRLPTSIGAFLCR